MLVKEKRIDGIEGAPQFLVSDSCYPQTLDVLRSRAEPLGIEIVLVPNELLDEADLNDRVFGALVQSPDSAHSLRRSRAGRSYMRGLSKAAPPGDAKPWAWP